MAKAKKSSKKKEAEPEQAPEFNPGEQNEQAPIAKDNTCKRCGFGYKLSEVVVREQKKCCPNCLGPLEWGA